MSDYDTIACPDCGEQKSIYEVLTACDDCRKPSYSVPLLAAHGIVEMAKRIYRDAHSGGCKLFSNPGCQCVLCRLDELHALIDKEHGDRLPTPAPEASDE